MPLLAFDVHRGVAISEGGVHLVVERHGLGGQSPLSSKAASLLVVRPARSERNTMNGRRKPSSSLVLEGRGLHEREGQPVCVRTATSRAMIFYATVGLETCHIYSNAINEPFRPFFRNLAFRFPEVQRSTRTPKSWSTVFLLVQYPQLVNFSL